MIKNPATGHWLSTLITNDLCSELNWLAPRKLKQNSEKACKITRGTTIQISTKMALNGKILNQIDY